jgi:hypothetical protein
MSVGQLTVSLFAAERIREKSRTCRICTSHLTWGGIGLCGDTVDYCVYVQYLPYYLQIHSHPPTLPSPFQTLSADNPEVHSIVLLASF